MSKPAGYYPDLIAEERKILATATCRHYADLGATISPGQTESRFLIGEVNAGVVFASKRPVALVYEGERGHGKRALLDAATVDAVIAECKEAGFDKPPIIFSLSSARDGLKGIPNWERDPRFNAEVLPAVAVRKLRLFRKENEVNIGFCQPKFYKPAVWAQCRKTMDLLCAVTPFVYRDAQRGRGHYWPTTQGDQLEAALLDVVPGSNRLSRALAAICCAYQDAGVDAKAVRSVEAAVAIAAKAFGDESPGKIVGVEPSPVTHGVAFGKTLAMATAIKNAGGPSMAENATSVEETRTGEPATLTTTETWQRIKNDYLPAADEPAQGEQGPAL